ncbi:hypothetical protein [Daejeonella sp.]|uniref:hypothetical protein n=1 Tax=Daejeonella sp. TaxID=2805397 RepID=UPI0025B8A3F5|nr:hypothetical protein [Daejeonella sp.]
MNKQTIANYKHFLIQAPTPDVEKINESTFTNYAKAWAHIGFLPILSKIDEYTYHVKLYLYASAIKDREELCMFMATYFRERFRQLSTKAKCNQILVYARIWLKPEEIASANSINDLEQSLLSILPDETPLRCNDLGEGVRHYLSNIPSTFHYWNDLILNGYFEADYEEKCRLEDEQKKLEESGSSNIKLHVFIKTGGQQPATWNAKDINNYFQGNIAKKWAMLNGYLPTYTGYTNGTIQFNLVTDPRCTDFNWISLCNKIAIQYKQEVNLLKDATNFEVKHFVVNDIIGFNIDASDAEKFRRLNERVKATYASMPKESSWTHYGKIHLNRPLTIPVAKEIELELDISDQKNKPKDEEPKGRLTISAAIKAALDLGFTERKAKTQHQGPKSQSEQSSKRNLEIKEQALKEIMENRNVSREEAERIMANPW